MLTRRFHYSFADDSLLIAALTHRSKYHINNERLEFLGDSILGFVVADELYRRFPKASEGELSRSRASLVKGDTLAGLARELELGDYLLLGPGELKSGGHRRNSILADAFEALIGAIFIDGGLDKAREFIALNYQALFENLSIANAAKDPKTLLQEFLQGRKSELPEYEVTATSGSAHQQTFTVTCRVSHYGIETEGTGGSRRKAEQAAADIALGQLDSKDTADRNIKRRANSRAKTKVKKNDKG